MRKDDPIHKYWNGDSHVRHKTCEFGCFYVKELKDIFEAAGVDVQVTGVSSLFHTLYKERGEKWRGCDECRQKKASRISSSSDREWSFFLLTKNWRVMFSPWRGRLEKLFREAENYARKVR